MRARHCKHVDGKPKKPLSLKFYALNLAAKSGWPEPVSELMMT